MRSQRSFTIAVLAVGVAISAGACAPDTEELEAELSELRSEVQDRRAAEQALDERLEDVEAAIAAPTDDGGTADRLDEVDGELRRIVDALTVLEADLDAEAGTRAELGERTDAADRELRSGLADLRGDLDAVRASLELLEDQIDVLRQRLDRVGG